MRSDNPYHVAGDGPRQVSDPGVLSLPLHASPGLAALRRGSPVLRLASCYVGLLLVSVLGYALLFSQLGQSSGADKAARMARGIQIMLWLSIPFLIALWIYGFKLVHRLAWLLQLDETRPLLGPRSLAALCCFPFLHLLGFLILAVLIRLHYPRICEQQDLDSPPPLNGFYFFVAAIISLPSVFLDLSWIMHLASLLLAVIGLVQAHKVLKFFSSRV